MADRIPNAPMSRTGNVDGFSRLTPPRVLTFN